MRYATARSIKQSTLHHGLYFILLGLLGVPFPVMAVDKPVLTACVGDWEGYSTPDLKGGVYIDTVNQIFSEGYLIKWTRYSFVRCSEDFKAGKFDILVGESDRGKVGVKGNVAHDSAFYNAIYLKSAFPKWDETTALKDKKIGFVRGYNIDRLVPFKMNFIEFNTLEQGLRQLLIKRFDVILDDDSDKIDKFLASPEFSGKGLKTIGTSVKEKIVLVFKESPLATKLVALSDEKITAMHKANAIKSIFDKYKLTYKE